MFAGFELTTPVSNRPQTFALDRSATGINKIRTRNPSKRSAADPRLRPFGHWNRQDSNPKSQQAIGRKLSP